MSDALRAGQAALFQSSRFADMVIRFQLEHTTVQPKKKQRANSAKRTAPIVFLGEPLPAHRSILCLCSGFISARLESWQSAVEDGAQGDGSTPSTGGRPEVLVTLGSEAELPHALEVIRFMYTGQLTQGLGFEALLHVRRLAGYLEVADCLRACDAELLAWVDGPGPCSSGGSSSSGSSGENGCNSRVLEAYRHHALFPDPETAVDPASFDPVLQALGRQLVPCLKDAVSVYTDPQLQQQWCALPACAVEAVLADDGFPTDDESTVLLLLACWLKHQSPPADPATTERLCRLIRASRLSPTYAALVLPHLDWFPAKPAELALIQLLVNAPDEAHREHLQQHAEMLHPVWAKAPKRKQLVAPAGRAVEWRVARSLLEQGVKEPVQKKGGAHKWVGVPMQLSGPGVLPGGEQLLSCGLLWSCELWATFAGTRESPKLKVPLVFRTSPSTPAEVSVPFAGALTCNLRWSLHKWSGGRRQVAWAGSPATSPCNGHFDTFAEVLPGAFAPGGDPLGVLASYLHTGELGGSITVQPAT